MFFLEEGELRKLNLSSRAISVAQWPWVYKINIQCMCNVSLWFLRLSESVSLNSRTPQWWVGEYNFRIFLLEEKITHRIEPLLIFAPYLLTLYIFSLSQVGNLSCSVAGRGYKQKMWNISLWFLRLSSSVEMNLMARQWWELGFKLIIKPMTMKEKLL